MIQECLSMCYVLKYAPINHDNDNGKISDCAVESISSLMRSTIRRYCKRFCREDITKDVKAAKGPGSQQQLVTIRPHRAQSVSQYCSQFHRDYIGPARVLATRFSQHPLAGMDAPRKALLSIRDFLLEHALVTAYIAAATALTIAPNLFIATMKIECLFAGVDFRLFRFDAFEQKFCVLCHRKSELKLIVIKNY